MTRKLISGVALMLLASSAFAQQGFYIGIGGGAGEVTTKDILVELPSGATTRQVLDTSETSYKLLAGYRFGKYFAIEGTYQDFQDPDPFGTGIDDGNGSEILGNIESSALQIAAVPSLSLADGAFDIFGRLGVSVVDEKLRFTATPPVAAVPQEINSNRDGSNTLLSYGLGAQLNLGQRKNFLIRAEWEQTQSEVADRYDYIGLSIGFKFGG